MHLSGYNSAMWGEQWENRSSTGHHRWVVFRGHSWMFLQWTIQAIFITSQLAASQRWWQCWPEHLLLCNQDVTSAVGGTRRSQCSFISNHQDPCRAKPQGPATCVSSFTSAHSTTTSQRECICATEEDAVENEDEDKAFIVTTAIYCNFLVFVSVILTLAEEVGHHHVQSWKLDFHIYFACEGIMKWMKWKKTWSFLIMIIFQSNNLNPGSILQKGKIKLTWKCHKPKFLKRPKSKLVPISLLLKMPNLETEINMFTAIENQKLLVVTYTVYVHVHINLSSCHCKHMLQTKQSHGVQYNKRKSHLWLILTDQAFCGVRKWCSKV